MNGDEWVLMVEFDEYGQVADAYVTHKQRGDRIAIGFRNGARTLPEIIEYGTKIVAAWNAEERKGED